MYQHHSIKQKIIEHLEGLNELERKTDAQSLIQTLADRYDAPVEVVEMAIAEWQAGKR